MAKVKKFGIGWCIPHRMAADNTKGGGPHGPPPSGCNRVKEETRSKVLAMVKRSKLKNIFQKIKIQQKKRQKFI